MSLKKSKSIRFYSENSDFRYTVTPNTCFLTWNNWDDFGFKTSFNLSYVDSDGNQKNIGYLRIMEKGQEGGSTSLPKGSFPQLPDNYCSLGTGQSYYEELMTLSPEVRINILESLRDCAQDNKLFEKYRRDSAMINSLLRNADDHQVKSLFPSILSGNAILTVYSFQYVIDDNKSTKIEVNVEPWSYPPTNIHVLIGRNGVGKTRILSGISDQLSKTTSPSEISQKGNLSFLMDEIWLGEEEGQKFVNFITVVFSAFDNFKPPIQNQEHHESVPCQYIGLKTKDGESFKDPKALSKEFSDSIKYCLSGHKKQRWIEAIEILDSDPIFKAYELYKLVNGDNSQHTLVKIFGELSSGHRIILLTITRLVELVDEKTLVLIDEPENHLHPPLLSSFIRTVSNLLIKRNGVALVATHSPVVLQEVPSSCVTIIDRVRSEYDMHRPSMETYAENIDTLTREIFGLELENSGFYKTINDKIQDGCTYDELMEEFDSQIGSEGRAVARSIISYKKKD